MGLRKKCLGVILAHKNRHTNYEASCTNCLHKILPSFDGPVGLCAMQLAHVLDQSLC